MNIFKKLFGKNKDNQTVVSLHSIVSEWIQTIERENSLPDDTVGLYFGIFEEGYTGNYMLYLVGSNNYDDTDSDWACMSNQTFIPENMYCPILPLSPGDSWEDDLKQITDCLKQIITETPTLRLWSVPYITAGFDEGEIELIYSNTTASDKP